MFGVASLALYASAPNHVFGQMLGLPSSRVLLPYVLLYRLRWHRENYCDCAPVHPDEHLSRESQKLTVMIKHETGQPLDDLALMKGCFPVMYVRAPYSDERGQYSSPTVKLLWLSESVKAI